MKCQKLQAECSRWQGPGERARPRAQSHAPRGAFKWNFFNHNRARGRREMERPKVGPKGTQAARVAARESAEGNPLWGEMSGSERVNIDERKRASQIFTNGRVAACRNPQVGSARPLASQASAAPPARILRLRERGVPAGCNGGLAARMGQAGGRPSKGLRTAARSVIPGRMGTRRGLLID